MGPGSVWQHKPKSKSKVNSYSDTQQRHHLWWLYNPYPKCQHVPWEAPCPTPHTGITQWYKTWHIFSNKVDILSKSHIIHPCQEGSIDNLEESSEKTQLKPDPQITWTTGLGLVSWLQIATKWVLVCQSWATAELWQCNMVWQKTHSLCRYKKVNTTILCFRWLYTNKNIILNSLLHFSAPKLLLYTGHYKRRRLVIPHTPTPYKKITDMLLFFHLPFSSVRPKFNVLKGERSDIPEPCWCETMLCSSWERWPFLNWKTHMPLLLAEMRPVSLRGHVLWPPEPLSNCCTTFNWTAVCSLWAAAVFAWQTLHWRW